MSSSPCLRSQRRWPLPWAAVKSTSEIFTGWCRMFGSMCLLMVTNVIFLQNAAVCPCHSSQRLRCSPWIVLILTIVKVARKARRHCNTHRLKSRHHRRLSGKRTPRHADLYGGSQCGFSNYKGSGQVRRKRRQRRCAQRRPAAPMGGPSGGHGNTAEYVRQSAAQQSSTNQSTSQQSSDAQSASVHTGAPQSPSQEKSAPSAAQDSMPKNSTAPRPSQERKSSVPLGTTPLSRHISRLQQRYRLSVRRMHPADPVRQEKLALRHAPVWRGAARLFKAACAPQPRSA